MMANTSNVEGSASARNRPRRFSLHAAVRYRADDGRWHCGITESISKSGLLMRADQPIQPETPIELEVELPPVRGEKPARLWCRGRTVRAYQPGQARSGAIVAVTIGEYRLDRRWTAVRH